MLANKEIKQLIKRHRGDFAKFCRFLSVSRDLLRGRLDSEKTENNLDGQYRAFILHQKTQDKK